MTKYTNAEMTRLRNAVLEKVYPLALKHRLSPAQLEDVTQRIVVSGKVFLTATDEVVGHNIEFLLVDMQSDPKLKHLFQAAEEPKTKNGDSYVERFGMSKAEFEALPAQRRLEYANAEAAKTKGRR